MARLASMCLLRSWVGARAIPTIPLPKRPTMSAFTVTGRARNCAPVFCTRVGHGPSRVIQGRDHVTMAATEAEVTVIHPAPQPVRLSSMVIHLDDHLDSFSTTDGPGVVPAEGPRRVPSGSSYPPSGTLTRATAAPLAAQRSGEAGAAHAAEASQSFLKRKTSLKTWKYCCILIWAAGLLLAAVVLAALFAILASVSSCNPANITEFQSVNEPFAAEAVSDRVVCYGIGPETKYCFTNARDSPYHHLPLPKCPGDISASYVDSEFGLPSNASSPTYVIIHGYLSSAENFFDLRDALISREPAARVLVVHWSRGAQASVSNGQVYEQAAANVRVLSAVVLEHLKSLAV